MTLVDDLALPAANPTDDIVGDGFHRALGEAAAQHWLARSPLGYLVLGREAAVELLRDRRLSFPSLQILELQGINDGPVYESAANGLMIKTGEPHARVRRLVAPAFTPRAADRLRPRLVGYLEELWAAIADDGRCDVVPAIARRLPSMAIAELLGLPGQDAQLAQWSENLQASFDMETAFKDRAALEAAYVEVEGWVGELVAERRAAPGDDLVSTLAAAEVDGDRLTDGEVVSLVCSVIAGGTDTTQAQLAHGLRLFAEHPDQWAALAATPELVNQAVAEVLRYEPITPFTARVVDEEMAWGGVTFPAGTVLFVCAATANRDPEVFADPDRFDITVDRGGAQVLTFGAGPHFCLGAGLARAELAEAFAFFAPRMPDLRLDGEPVYGSPAGIYPMQSVPVRWGP